MRAFIQWLALAPLLVFTGCSSLPPPPRPECLESGLSLSPSDAHLGEALAHYSQALVLEASSGLSREAIVHYKQAAALDPAHIPVSFKVAADYIGRKDYTGAVYVLKALELAHPESVEIHLLLGSVYQACDRLQEARHQFGAVVRLAPERPDGYIRLATLLAMELKSRQALAIVKEGLRRVKDPKPLSEYCETVGHLLVGLKDVEGALGFFEQALKVRPDHVPLRAELARCFVLVGRNKQALEQIVLLQKQSPDDPLIAAWQGEMHELLGQEKLALEAYTRAGRSVPLALPVALRKANLEMQLDPRVALVTLETVLRDHSDDLRLRVYLALLHMHLEQYGEALIHLDAVARQVERDPLPVQQVLPLFYFWYGSACERAGRFEEGEQYLARYLAANPEAPEGLNYLAYMWAERGINLEQATAYIRKALSHDPDNGAFLDTQAWILYKQGDYAKAYELLRRALRQTGDDSSIFDHLGDVCAALNRSGEARKWWLKSLKLAPKNSSVRWKLTQAGVDTSGLGD